MSPMVSERRSRTGSSGITINATAIQAARRAIAPERDSQRIQNQPATSTIANIAKGSQNAWAVACST